MKSPVFQSNPALVMTYRKWLTHAFNPRDIIFNASAVDHSDFHQQHPIGVSVFLIDGFPQNPDDFYPVCKHFSQRMLANAIFSPGTTNHKGFLRVHAQQQLQHHKSFIYCHLRQSSQRLAAKETIDWYLSTPFTISPRGNGLDCHRNYEALLFKSIPLIMGADETLREKYARLPVIFVKNYTTLSEQQLQSWYGDMLDKEYDFNMLSLKYWAARRPDVDIHAQTRYWLNVFKKTEHVEQYLHSSDLRGPSPG
jgi:hypothetical protein